MLAIFPELVTIANKKDWDRLAIGVRTYFLNEKGQLPRIQLQDLADSIGLRIEKANFAHYGALVVKDDQGKFSAAIFMRDDLKSSTAQFLLAHILGHVFIHVLPKIADSSWKTGGFKETINPRERYLIQLSGKKTAQDLAEFEADEFAASLLLPAGMLRRAFNALKSISKTAEFFDVEETVVAKRLELLGLVEGPKIVQKNKSDSISPMQRKRGLDRIREIAKNLEK